MLAYAQECTRRTHTVSCGWTNVHDMLRNEPHLQIQRISTSKSLHAPCSAMRLMDDTRKRCNEKTTYIMPCVWDHAHDVMRQWCDASGTRAVFHSCPWFNPWWTDISMYVYIRVRGVTYPKVYELTPPHGTPLTPRSQELTPNRNHHGTPALTDRFFDWFLTFLRDLVHFASICGCFTFDPNVKVRMAHLETTS